MLKNIAEKLPERRSLVYLSAGTVRSKFLKLSENQSSATQGNSRLEKNFNFKPVKNMAIFVTEKVPPRSCSIIFVVHGLGK